MPRRITYLLKKVCPFCDSPDSFTRRQDVNSHITNIHLRTIRTGDGSLPPSNYMVYELGLSRRLPNIPIRLSCPCCQRTFDYKAELRLHFEEQHLEP